MIWANDNCGPNLQQPFHVNFIDVNFDESERVGLHHAIKGLQQLRHGRNWNSKRLDEKNQLSRFQVFQRRVN